MMEVLVFIALWCQPLPSQLQIDCRNKLFTCLDKVYISQGTIRECIKQVDFTKVK